MYYFCVENGLVVGEMRVLDVCGEQLYVVHVPQLVLLVCHLLDESGNVVEEVLSARAFGLLGEVDQAFLRCHVSFKY